MMLPLDAIVITEGNEKAVRVMSETTQEHDYSVNLFLVGPAESGKTMLMRARHADKDLLSTKSTLYRPCKELPEALRADVYDGYLEELAEVDVLFLDDFDGFFEDAELGPAMCKLLLQERARRGNDTVISARKALGEYDLSVFEGALDDFVELGIKPLGENDMLDYVQRVYEQYREEESPVLSSEALAYVANGLEAQLEMKRRAIFYLLKGYRGEPGAELSRNFVEQAIADAWDQLKD